MVGCTRDRDGKNFQSHFFPTRMVLAVEQLAIDVHGAMRGLWVRRTVASSGATSSSTRR
jgi:hypothetical protein